MRINLGGRIIETTQGCWVLVDAADYDDLLQYSWSAAVLNTNRPTLQIYAQRQCKTRKRTLTMHRHIMEEPDGHVDHINRLTWDNRRSNLRVVSQAENNRNKPDLYIHKSTDWARRLKPFIVRRGSGPQRSFKTVEEARVYRDTLFHG